jgi:predicted protein tyrosine phosphatase
MVEIIPNLFVGDEADYERRVRREPGWCVVHACKEPYHRQALGYTGRATSKTHPEYLVARRGDRLILNFIDADDPAYVPREMVEAAITFIGESLAAGRRVLVHCNQGESRGPFLAFLYLLRHTDKIQADDFAAAEAAFRKLYPAYMPKRGVRTFLANEFRRLRGGEQDRGRS